MVRRLLFGRRDHLASDHAGVVAAGESYGNWLKNRETPLGFKTLFGAGLLDLDGRACLFEFAFCSLCLSLGHAFFDRLGCRIH
jgi:hypothetical protein